jgi:hypothetical protein
MYEKIIEILNKKSYTNEKGENILPLSEFDDIAEQICKAIEDNF